MKPCKQKTSWSIKTKLIVIITSFTATAMLLLVLTQAFFLDNLYQHIKMHSIRNAASEIVSSVGSGELVEYMEYWHVKEQLEILLVDENGDVLYRAMSDAMEHERFDRASLQELFRTTAENGGTYHVQDSVELSAVPKEPPFDKKPNKPEVNEAIEKKERHTTSEQLMYARLSEPTEAGQRYMVLIAANLTPVSATVRTLAFQFVLAILLLVALSIVISQLIAQKIARPIIEINKSAKALATGNYRTPATGGYREVEELMATLSKASEDLKRSEQLQQELFANVSHDLRTPLTMITGYGEAIRDLPGEDSAENIQVVIDEANRLTRLVNDVLDLSKLRAGTQMIDKQPLELSEVVRMMTEHCRRLVEPHGMVLQYETDGEVMVEVDELRLSQVMYNLIGNALDHVGEDKTVSVRLERRGDRARVSVTDHGEGIPEIEQEEIWKRYYSTAKTAEYSGLQRTGLGLSIVRTVVELHGGLCGVTSEEGTGSTFWFELPCLKN